MKVALDYDPALRGQGGIARYVRRLVPYLLEADPTMELYLIGSRREGMPAHQRVRAVVHGLPPKVWRLMLLAGLAARGLPVLALPDVDVFHATDFAFPAEGVGIRRVVVTIHDLSALTHPEAHTFLNRSALRLFFHALRRRRYHVITPSAFVAHAVTRLLDYPPSRVTPIPLGAGMALPAGARERWE